MKNIQVRLLTLLIMLIPLFLFAQPLKQDVIFQHLTSDNGLSSNEVLSTFQDSKGFIWISSHGGLNRFDGVNSKAYPVDKKDSTKLHTVLISQVAEDKNGNLWISTLNEGLAFYNRNKDIFTHITTSSVTPYNLPENRLSKVKNDSDGNIWFGMSKMGFGKIVINGESLEETTLILHKNLDKKSQVENIYEDEAKNIWIAKTDGFCVASEKQGEIEVKHLGDVYYQPIWNETDNLGNLFFCVRGSVDNGSLRNLAYMPKGKPLESKHLVWLTTGPKMQDYLSYRFFFNKENQLVGFDESKGGFIAEIDYANSTIKLIQQFKNDLTNPRTIGANTNRHIMKDETGVIWVSLYNKGISRFDLEQKKFLHIAPSNKEGGLRGNSVYSLVEDQYGALWMSVLGNDLHYLAPGKSYDEFRYYSSETSLVNTQWLFGMRETTHKSGKSLWFASWDVSQANDYHPDNADNFKSLQHKANKGKKGFFASGTYFNFFQDSKGIIWGGVYNNGLSRIELDDDRNIKTNHYTTHDANRATSLSHATVRCVFEDHKNTIWVTGARGLNKLTNDYSKDSVLHFKRYLHDPNDSTSLPHNSHLCIFEDSKKRLWLGSLGGGLILVSRDEHNEITRFKSYTTKQGMPDDVIKAILEDSHGNLWISSGGGLTKFNPDTEDIINYTKEDGLQEDNFRDLSFVERKNGQFLFGGINGLNVFYPDSIKRNEYPPKVELTDFKVHGESITPQKEYDGLITLNRSITNADTVIVTSNQSIIEFSFAALHYAIPEKNNVEYQLLGFDKDWVKASIDRRFASYTNLDGGTYTFQVKGSNNDGVWSKEVAQITLIVLPPWWKTTWFKFVLFIFVVLCALAYNKIRTRAIKAENDRLEKLVNQRTEKLALANAELVEHRAEIIAQNDSILAHNTEIKQQSEELKTINDEVNEQKASLQKTYDNIKLLGEFGQHITSVLHKDDIANMAYKYIQHFVEADIIGLGLLAGRKQVILYSHLHKQGVVQDQIACILSDEHSLTGLCVAENKMITYGDLPSQMPEYVKHSVEIDQDEPAKSVIFLPLVIEGTVQGVLMLQHHKQNYYEKSHIDILTNLVSYISVSIANADSYQLIQKKNNDIDKSIHYAQTIQEAILPLTSDINQVFNFFSIFKPKDVVSGDFYWYHNLQPSTGLNHHLFAVIDCTGHGVPGAIMSIVCNGALNRIVKERDIHQPAAILEALDHEIRTILKQDKTENQDGMDVCLCKLEFAPNETCNVLFSASKRPLFIYRAEAKELSEIKGTRRYIGGVRSKKINPFETQNITLQKNDVIYLTSDGYVDQHNESRSRFGTTQMKELLKNIGGKTVQEQEDILLNTLNKHMESEEQRDDITLVGLKIK